MPDEWGLLACGIQHLASRCSCGLSENSLYALREAFLSRYCRGAMMLLFRGLSGAPFWGPSPKDPKSSRGMPEQCSTQLHHSQQGNLTDSHTWHIPGTRRQFMLPGINRRRWLLMSISSVCNAVRLGSLTPKAYTGGRQDRNRIHRCSGSIRFVVRALCGGDPRRWWWQGRGRVAGGVLKCLVTTHSLARASTGPAANRNWHYQPQPYQTFDSRPTGECRGSARFACGA